MNYTQTTPILGWSNIPVPVPIFFLPLFFSPQFSPLTNVLAVQQVRLSLFLLILFFSSCEAMLLSPSLAILRVCSSLLLFYFFASELRSCGKVEVAVLGSPSLIVLVVSVDVKQHWTRTSSLLSSYLFFSQHYAFAFCFSLLRFLSCIFFFFFKALFFLSSLAHFFFVAFSQHSSTSHFVVGINW